MGRGQARSRRVHGTWDVILALALGLYSISLAATQVAGRRARARGDQQPVEQDWLLIIFVISLTVLFLISEDASDHAIWPWTTVVVVVAITGPLLAAREVRRRRGARRPS
jgi:cell division protein FtsW (lipid II flippase)